MPSPNATPPGRLRRTMRYAAIAAALTIALTTAAAIARMLPPQNMPTVYSGTPAKLGEFPHQVALQRSDDSLVCGGALIALDWILTAAHCLDDKIAVVRAGTVTLTGGQMMKMGKAWQDPRYKPRALILAGFVDGNEEVKGDAPLFDVGLIHLDQPFVGDSNVKTISYAKNRDEEVLGGERQRGVAGWGRTNKGVDPPLLIAEVEIVPLADCQKIYGPALTNDIICAGGAKAHHCEGDSGGPLTSGAKWREPRMVIGVASFGFGCGKRAPGGYARIIESAKWIENCMKGDCRKVD